MSIINLDELKQLSQHTQGPAVSIYMPTQRAGPETRENPIRFKNRLKDAEEQLAAAGLRSVEIDQLLEPCQKLLIDNLFWQHQQHGLAMFFTNDDLQRYRLPMSVDELTVVSDRFHIKPLLPLFSNDGHFYVLVASLNRIRMLEATRHAVSEVPLEDMPTSLADFLRYDEFERSLQHHVTLGQGRGAGLGQGRGDAMFHGHGAGGDDDRKKIDILRFFQQIDNGVREMLNETRAPLVFAGVDYLFGIYKEANKYRYLLDQAVSGNFDEARDEEVHEQAWPLVAPRFSEAQAKAHSSFAALEGTGRTATDVAGVIEAAGHGRVDTLFVAGNQHQWGVYDRQTGQIELHDEEQPGSEDLLDLAAVQTLLNRGSVYTVAREDVPSGGKLAAILRY